MFFFYLCKYSSFFNINILTMNKISFVFRNKIQEIDFSKSEFTPNSTLLEFLRTQQDAKGTKEGCNEGDCGACTVVLIEKNNDKIFYKAVNSCVMFLPSVHGKQVITIEDLGSLENLHPIQQIFVEKHASQCGFCTPGFIMSLFAQKAQKINSTKDELLEAISGNLCRCTGYRPIKDAAFAVYELNDKKDFEKFSRPDLIEKIDTEKTITVKKEKYNYFLPFKFSEALILRKKYPKATISAGSTDLVLKVTKRKEPLYNIIDISAVKEINYIIETDNSLEIGAGTDMEDIYQFVKQKYKALSEMLSLFGAKQIRNRATIGGNIATASPIGDITPVLFAYDADIIVSGKKERKININDFITGYRQTVLKLDELIKKIVLKKPKKNTFIKSYKISKRHYLDISTISAAFCLSLNNDKIEDIILAFGGMAAMTKRAVKTEQFLKAKEFNRANLQKASEITAQDFMPITDARSSKEARIIMAKNLIIKFYEQISKKIK